MVGLDVPLWTYWKEPSVQILFILPSLSSPFFVQLNTPCVVAVFMIAVNFNWSSGSTSVSLTRTPSAIKAFDPFKSFANIVSHLSTV